MERWKIKQHTRRQKIVLEEGGKEFNKKGMQGRVFSRLEGEPAQLTEEGAD